MFSFRCFVILAVAFVPVLCHQPAQITVMVYEEWEGKACHADIDCKIDVSYEWEATFEASQPLCHRNTCLCPVDHYYSKCSRFCVPNCQPSNLVDTFSVYDASGMRGHNNWNFRGNATECKYHCSRIPNCLNIEVSNGGFCHGANINPGMAGVYFCTNCGGWTHFQRNCR